MLQRICYVVLTISAAAMAAVMISSRLAHHSQMSSISPGLTRGDSIAELEIVTAQGHTSAISSAGHSLIVFFSRTCTYCLESLSTYRAIALTKCDLRLSFVVVDHDSEALDTWWTENAWPLDSSCADVKVGRAVGSLRPFALSATPTHLLVDKAHRIVATRVGALTALPPWLDLDES